MDVTNSVALVTGGASGLGAATVRRLHQEGAQVVILDLPTSNGRTLSDELGPRVRFAPANVTDPGQVQDAVELASELGPLRVLVNCAGIGTPGKVLGRDGVLPLEEFIRVVRVNLVGTFNVLRLAAAAMAHTDPVEPSPADGRKVTPERGVIINTASVAAFDGQIGQPAYAASKGGIVAMTLPIAREMARSQIRVMTIAPGIFETPLLAGLPADAQESLGQQVPHPARLGQPQEYADLVWHIIQNQMLNGETIRLDGAIRMAPK